MRDFAQFYSASPAHLDPEAVRQFELYLLENGTDTHVIQALLGHSRIDTTARYTQVSARVVRGTPSPLDALVRPPKPRSGK